MVVVHLSAVAILSFAIGRNLYRSSLQLPPAQETRLRVSKRSHLVPIFASLAVLSFCVAGYAGTAYASLSYKVWAEQRGLEVPLRSVVLSCIVSGQIFWTCS